MTTSLPVESLTTTESTDTGSGDVFSRVGSSISTLERGPSPVMSLAQAAGRDGPDTDERIGLPAGGERRPASAFDLQGDHLNGNAGVALPVSPPCLLRQVFFYFAPLEAQSPIATRAMPNLW